MTSINMPLWFDWLDDEEWWEQLDDVPTGESPRSWIAREVDEIIADEEADDPNYLPPF